MHPPHPSTLPPPTALADTLVTGGVLPGVAGVEFSSDGHWLLGSFVEGGTGRTCGAVLFPLDPPSPHTFPTPRSLWYEPQPEFYVQVRGAWVSVLTSYRVVEWIVHDRWWWLESKSINAPALECADADHRRCPAFRMMADTLSAPLPSSARCWSLNASSSIGGVVAGVAPHFLCPAADVGRCPARVMVADILSAPLP